MNGECKYPVGCTVEMHQDFRKPSNSDLLRGVIKKADPSNPLLCYYIEFESGAKGWYGMRDVESRYAPIEA